MVASILERAGRRIGPAGTADAARGRRLLAAPVIVGLAILVAFWLLSPIPATSDAYNYWQLNLADPYHNRWADPDSFVYSPAFGQMLYPFTLLPFEVFYRLLQGVNLVLLGWFLGPAWAALALLLPPVQSELSTNNVHLPLAFMCLVGVRYPSVWAFGLLTKVTPGVGLLWFAARREWRNLVVALGTTVVIVMVSAAVWPSAWIGWLDLLSESSTKVVGNFSVSQWPALLRLPIGAGLTIMAAWRSRPAALPVIVMFCLPSIWLSALVMLAAVPRMMRRD